MEATAVAAKRVIAFDMESVANKNNSVISACMFGALAASKVLPFRRDSFEAVIKSGGKGIEPSLNAFRAAHDHVAQPSAAASSAIAGKTGKRFSPLPDSAGRPELNSLLARIREFPAPLHNMLFAGVKRVTDFQDPTYANEYLDRISKIYELDNTRGAAKAYALTAAAAKYVAIAMAYDDVIRVAELKTRQHRYERVVNENSVGQGQIVYTTEYMHPRLEEAAGTMPAPLGRLMEAHPRLFGWLFRKPRRVRSGTLHWFLILYGLAAFKRIRRTTLRHTREMAHLERWLSLAAARTAENYDLAVEIINARRLIKGYSDTHARGESKFDRVIGAVPLLVGRPDGADWMRRLRDAALVDESGIALDGALNTIAAL